MENDILLRYALGATLAPLLPYGIYSRLKAHTKEPLDRRQEGWPILISLRLCGLALWVSLIAWFLRAQWLDSSALTLPMWARWLGMPVLFVAAGWLVWMFRWLGSNVTDTVVTRKNAYLVTEGPYRWVRHPMYAGILMLTVAFALITSNWLFALLGSVAFLLLRTRTNREERNLLARFGDSYREYMRRTGRFLPRLQAC